MEAYMKNFFPRLLGNNGVKNRIGRAIESGTLPHAFLIDGPRGSGKMTLALEIAAALNCDSKESESLPCGRCNNCRRIYAREYVDVKVLERQPDKATLGVGEIKEFRRDMFLSSTESEYKIYIIKDAERMTAEAQNALLIVLEEPPKNVIIMLLAAGTDTILTTIKSRAQYITMSSFSKEELKNMLPEIHPEASRLKVSDPEKFEAVIVGAGGRLGSALLLLDPRRAKANEEERERVMGLISAISPRKPYSAMYAAISALPTKRVELMESLEGVISALRDMIAVKNDERGITLLFYTSEEAAKDAAKDMGIRQLLRVYDTVIRAHRECAKNANVGALLTSLGAEIKLV